MSLVGNTPIEAYEAFAEKTKPVCLFLAGTDIGLSVNVYYSKKKGIKGVEVYGEGGDFVGEIGKVPKSAKAARA